MKANTDKAFPSHGVWLNRFGPKRNLAERVLEYCRTHAGFEDVATLCEAAVTPPRVERKGISGGNEVEFGSVYLLKSGRYYKIGRSNAAGRRERELAIQLPEKAKILHVIQTDDPVGIEEYWHKRFCARRMNGEWFILTATEIAAFKRRKFM